MWGSERQHHTLWWWANRQEGNALHMLLVPPNPTSPYKSYMNWCTTFAGRLVWMSAFGWIYPNSRRTSGAKLLFFFLNRFQLDFIRFPKLERRQARSLLGLIFATKLSPSCCAVWEHCRLVIFVIAAFSGGSLRDVAPSTFLDQAMHSWVLQPMFDQLQIPS